MWVTLNVTLDIHLVCYSGSDPGYRSYKLFALDVTLDIIIIFCMLLWIHILYAALNVTLDINPVCDFGYDTGCDSGCRFYELLWM